MHNMFRRVPVELCLLAARDVLLLGYCVTCPSRSRLLASRRRGALVEPPNKTKSSLLRIADCAYRFARHAGSGRSGMRMRASAIAHRPDRAFAVHTQLNWLSVTRPTVGILLTPGELCVCRRAERRVSVERWGTHPSAFQRSGGSHEAGWPSIEAGRMHAATCSHSNE